MMMVPNALNLETGLTLQTGLAPGKDASADNGFTAILATLDAGTLALAAPFDAATLVPAPAALIETPEADGTPDQQVDDQDGDEIAQVASQAADTAAKPPFVAPPIAIGVSNASPIVVERAFLAQQGDVVSAQKQATSTTVSVADAAGDMSAKSDLLVAALARMEPVAPRVALPIGLAPLADGKLAQRVGAVADDAVAISSPADPIAIIAQADASAAPLLPPLPAAAAADTALLADVAPDTARQLGEQAMAARLDVADETAMIDRLARDLAQLSGSEGRLKFQLNPEHLGSLHVEVEQRAEGVSLRFGTETEGARQVIADAQHRLVNEARAQGMRIAETHVDLSSQNQQGSGRGNTAQQPVVITRGETPDTSAPAVPVRRAGVERFA